MKPSLSEAARIYEQVHLDENNLESVFIGISLTVN